MAIFYGVVDSPIIVFSHTSCALSHDVVTFEHLVISGRRPGRGHTSLCEVNSIEV